MSSRCRTCPSEGYDGWHRPSRGAPFRRAGLVLDGAPSPCRAWEHMAETGGARVLRQRRRPEPTVGGGESARLVHARSTRESPVLGPGVGTAGGSAAFLIIDLPGGLACCSDVRRLGWAPAGVHGCSCRMAWPARSRPRTPISTPRLRDRHGVRPLPAVRGAVAARRLHGGRRPDRHRSGGSAGCRRARDRERPASRRAGLRPVRRR